MSVLSLAIIEREITADTPERDLLLLALASCKTTRDWSGLAQASHSRTGPESYAFRRTWVLKPCVRALINAVRVEARDVLPAGYDGNPNDDPIPTEKWHSDRELYNPIEKVNND